MQSGSRGASGSYLAQHTRQRRNSERRVISWEDNPKGSTLFPAHCQFAHSLPYFLAHLLTGNISIHMLFPLPASTVFFSSNDISFLLKIHPSLFCWSYMIAVGFCPARVSMWPRPKLINTPGPAGCVGWSRTENMTQLECENHNESFAKNFKREMGGAVTPILPSGDNFECENETNLAEN